MMELCFPSQNCGAALRILERLIVSSCLMSCVMTSVLVRRPHSNANGIKAIIGTPVKWRDWQLHGSLAFWGERRKKLGQQRII